MEGRAMISSATGAMNCVLLKLATLLEDERNPRTRNSIIALGYALSTMRSFIERRPGDPADMDPLVKGWMDEVREMTYDLEDCIDDFVRSAAPSDTNRAVLLFKMVKSRGQYARLLQQIKERVCEASERRSRYEIACDPGDQMELPGSPSTPSDGVPIDRRLPVFSAHPGDRLVGVEGPRDQLIDLLAPDGHQQLKMVSIVGFGGMGKTTLAMDVYENLKERFDCHTVVSLSRCDDLVMIFRSILSQVGVQEFDLRGCNQGQLRDKLREFLKTRRYFIVIDDIRDLSALKMIRWAFPENDLGSRILVTTRIISMDRSSCCFSEDYIFRMKPLSDVESRKLFFRRIFQPGYSCPPHLEEISLEILNKCGGLPLAILTIASLLAMKTEEVCEWVRVRDSIGSVLDVTHEGIKHILSLSYYDLPSHLRTCLLYLGMFPEDYIIIKELLIRRWVAEGFIIEKHGKSSEEIAECYFNELINRSLIQPVGIQYDGRIEACRVHDIILDLMVSMSAKENFVTISDGRDYNFGLQYKIRRLSLRYNYDHESTFMPSATTASHIRSLAVIMTDKKMPTLPNFRALRVLDLESDGELKDAKYLQNIGKCYLLKYLRLRTTSFVELPEQLVELQFLQTLDLTRALIRKLPCGIGRLKKLNYLLVKNVKLPDGIGELQGLQQLSHVEVESSNSVNGLKELGRLTMLRVLGLNWCIRDTDTSMKICADSLVSAFNKLGTSDLKSLHIGTGSGCSLDFLLDFMSGPFYHLQEFRMTSDYYFPRIPEWMTSLVSLTLLEINTDTAGEEVLKILGKLPSLLVLLLSVKSAALKQGLVIRSSGFQCLKQFDFICWKSWVMLSFERGSMLALEKLHLKFQAKGMCVHNGFLFDIEHIASLKYVHVDIGCTDAEMNEVEAAESAIKSAVLAHPSHPRLELQRWREDEIAMNEITAHGKGTEGRNDVGPAEIVEGELIAPAGSWHTKALRTSQKFLELEIHIIPELKKLLQAVDEERMLQRGLKKVDSDVATLDRMADMLRHAQYEAEDILDLVEHHWTERKVVTCIGGIYGTVITCIAWCNSWWQRLNVSVATCCMSLLGIRSVSAHLLQWAQKSSLYCWFIRSSDDIIFVSAASLGEPPVSTTSATSSHEPPVPATSFSGYWICCWSSFFNFFNNCYLSMSHWLLHVIVVARSFLKWSYDVVGIKSYQENATALDSVPPAISRRNLKKRIMKVESIISEVKKSRLLDVASKSTLNDICNINWTKVRSHTRNDIVNMNRRKFRSSSSKREVFGRDVLLHGIMAKILYETSQGDAPSSSRSICYSVIGIYGAAGCGKTTLARYVLDHIEQKYENKLFDTIMGIHVSETFNVDDIFHNMLKDITKDSHLNIKDREDLQAKLEETLRGKRFFLILDDLWVKDNNHQELKELLSPLNVGMKGSKILVTSQREDAVRALGADEPIAIPDLDDEQYLTMFMHYALDGIGIHDEEFRPVGRKIARKLEGSPIAALTVAGQLRRNPDISFWKRTAELDVLNGVMGALWWSYMQLDVDIRRCFEYCNIFPRRFKLRTYEVVPLWIAQGFVKTSCATENIEVVAEGYMQQLVSCSFLQPDGTTDCFIMHDLLHDLAREVAGSDCFRIENARSQRGEGWKGDIPRDTHHLFVQNYDAALINKILKLENLRTLVIFTAERVEVQLLEDKSKSLRKLRVLAVGFCNILCSWSLIKLGKRLNTCPRKKFNIHQPLKDFEPDSDADA